MKKLGLCAAGATVLLIGNEIISLAVLTVLAAVGIAALFGAIAEVGNW